MITIVCENCSAPLGTLEPGRGFNTNRLEPDGTLKDGGCINCIHLFINPSMISRKGLTQEEYIAKRLEKKSARQSVGPVVEKKPRKKKNV